MKKKKKLSDEVKAQGKEYLRLIAEADSYIQKHKISPEQMVRALMSSANRIQEEYNEKRKKASRKGPRERGPSEPRRLFEAFIGEKRINWEKENQKSFLDKYEVDLNNKGVSTTSIKKYFSEKKKSKKPNRRF